MEMAVADRPLLGIRTRMMVSVLVDYVVAGTQRRQFLLAQRVAVGVGAAVHTDQQDVDRAVVATVPQRWGEHVVDPVFEGPNLAPRHSGAEHDHDGSDGGDHTSHTLRRHHFRLLLSRWYAG